MIYGEESGYLDFSKGLWISDSTDIHPGYCSELKNLLVTPSGTLVMRPSMIQALNSLHQVAGELPVSDTLPYSSLPYYPNFYTRATLLNPANNATNVPILFEPHTAVPSGATVLTNLVNYKCPSTTEALTNPVSPQVHQWSGVGYPSSNYVQYLDRIYAFWSNNGVHKVTNWQFNNATVTNLTRTLVAGSPTTNISSISYAVFLDIYKDRMFLSFGNKVYYTDTATAGGYPETWDTAANLFTLPVRTIFKTYVVNNIMYFFTSGGVWTLQALGPPESWIVKCVNDTISINHMNAVCLNKGLFFYVNVNGIWATTGSSDPVRVSHPIDEYLEKCGGIGVFAFEEGILVCAQTYRQHATVATSVVLDESLIFYFDGSTWAELKLPAFTSGFNNNNCIVVGTFLQVPADASNQRITTYMTVINGADTEGWLYSTWFLSRTHSIGDGFFSNSYDFSYLNYDTHWSMVTSDFVANESTGKRVKFGYLNSYVSEEIDIDISLNLDGRGYNDELIETRTLKPGLNEDGNTLSQFSVDSYVRRLGIKLEGMLDPSNVIVGAVSKPSTFEIKTIKLIFSTGRKEDDIVAG